MSEPGPAPFLPGFTVEWDPLNQEWLAVSSSGRFRIRGRDQADHGVDDQRLSPTGSA